MVDKSTTIGDKYGKKGLVRHLAINCAGGKEGAYVKQVLHGIDKA